MFGAIAVLSALDRSNPKRWANAAFWGLFSTSFLFGDYLGDLGNGVLVLAMVVLAGIVGLGFGRARDQQHRRAPRARAAPRQQTVRGGARDSRR